MTSSALALMLAFSPSCGDDGGEAVEPSSEEMPRSGEMPSAGQIEGEVLELRAQPVVLADASPVGALPAEASVDASGEANYVIPIEVAPGPRGMQPQLSVAYGSNGDDGMLGHRFDLSGLSAISRCPKTVVDDGAYGPIRFDDSDALCINGERLIQASGVHGQAGAEYRPKRNPFDRVVLDTDMDQFGGTMTVHTRDRRVLTFGTAGGSLWKGETLGTQVPYRWNIVRQCDRWENCIDYTYQHGAMTATGPTEIRIMEIRYGGIGIGASKRRVNVSWQDRTDPATGWLFGVELRRTKVIDDITVTGPWDTVVRRYDFEYAESEFIGKTQLASATLCTADDVCLPLTTFEWSNPSNGAFNLDEWEGIGDVGSTLPEEQVALLQARNTLVGDFDGDGDDEFLFRRSDAASPWIMWFGGDEEDEGNVLLPVLENKLPFGNEFAESLLEAALVVPDPWSVTDELAENLHRFQPEFTMSVIDFDGDLFDDILFPLRGGYPAEDGGLDADQHAYAESFAVAINTGGGGYALHYPDDGSDEKIYTILPTDHDGDGFTDVWMCQGKRYHDAHWVLAHHRGGNEPQFGYEYLATDVACSVHDELTFASIDGGPASLLVIPAYDAPAGELIPADERGAYQRLRLDLETGASSLQSSGLPRDTYQRTHDYHCRNGLALAAYGAPIFSAGLGHDKQLDLNEDGLVDVLRFELVGGDENADMPAIADGLEVSDWGDGVLCGTDDELDYDAEIVPYFNTGMGFIRGDAALEMDGNAHANLWLNFVGSVMTDVNDDGRVDLVLPGHGPGTGWTALGVLASGEFAQDTVGLPEGWPAYTSADDWREQLEAFAGVRVIVFDDNPGERPELAFVGLVEGEQSDWPTVVNIFQSTSGDSNGRVELVVDGLGAWDDFEYDAVYSPDPYAGKESAPLRHALWVTHRHEHSIAGGSRSTDYEYEWASQARRGGEFLGFRRVHTQSGPERTLTSYVSDFDDDVGDFATRGHPTERVEYTSVDYVDGSGFTGEHVSRSAWTWTTTPIDLAGGLAYFSYAAALEETGYRFRIDECEPEMCLSYDTAAAYREKTTTETRDDFAVLTSSTQTVKYSPLAALSTTTVTQSSIEHDLDAWIIGKVGRVEVQSCDRRGECDERVTTSVIDDVTGEPTSVTVQPDDASLVLKSDLTYDGHGNVETITQSHGDDTRTTTIAWDGEGVFQQSMTNPLGQVSYVVNDVAGGAEIAVVDPAGLTTRTAYDGFYRAVAESLHSSPLGPDDEANVTIAYSAGTAAMPLVVETTAEHGQRTTEKFGAVGEVLERRWYGLAPVDELGPDIIPAGGEVYELYGYDERGEDVERSVPQWVGQDPVGWHRRTVDALGRVTSKTAPDDTVLERIEYLHDGTSDETRVRTHRPDSKDKWTFSDMVVGPNGTGRRHYDENKVATCFEHGPFEQIATVMRNCEGAGPHPTFTTTYDSLGHPAFQHDPYLGGRISVWNAFGELASHTDGAGRPTSYVYDAIGRISSRTDPDGDTTFVWDADRVGALDGNFSPDGVAHDYDYDEFGRVVMDTAIIPGASGNDVYTFTSSYGPGGRLETLAYPTPDGEPAFTARYRYDEAGYLRGALDDATGAEHYLLREGSASSKPALESYGNGVQTERTYDPKRQWIERIVTTGSPATQDLAYEWSANGELSSRTDNLRGQFEEFGYDATFRLTTAIVHKGPASTQRSATYDALGNFTSLTGVAGYTYDASARLTAVNGASVSHFADGAVSKMGTKEFTYTPFAKVRSIKDGAKTLDFIYDADGDRVRRRDSAGDTITVDKLYERKLNSIGTPITSVCRVAVSDRIVSQVVRTKTALAWNESVEYLHDDHLGSTNLVSSSTAIKPITVVSALSHDAWGRARKSEDWNVLASEATAAKPGIGFTGHRAELDAGLIDMGGRMYDPTIARFTSADPIVSDPDDGNAYNRYAYVGNRPLRFTDPTGWSAQGDDDGPSFGSNESVWQAGIDWANAQARRFDGGFVNHYDDFGTGDLWGLSEVSVDDLGRTVMNVWETGLSPIVYAARRAYDEAGELAAFAQMIHDSPKEAAIAFGVGVVTSIASDVETVTSAYGKMGHQISDGDFAGALQTWADASVAAFNLAALAVNSAGSITKARTLIRSAKRGAAVAARGYKAFTASNFRHNLAVKTGKYPLTGQAHHVFPQAFRARYPKGLNIDDPKYGAWWGTISHLKNAKRYNMQWDAFLSKPRSVMEIEMFGRSIMSSYGILPNY